jgi:GGDEF domain-containing protein
MSRREFPKIGEKDCIGLRRGIIIQSMDNGVLPRILKEYLLPIVVPGLAVVVLFVGLMFLPFGGFDSGASISQVIVNLIDTALVIALISIFAFSLRYFRARGFYFLLLLMVQLWYLQQGDANADGIFWTQIFVPFSFLLFLLMSERGLFSPRTRLLLIIIAVPVLLRFLFEQYLNLPLTDIVRGTAPFAGSMVGSRRFLSFWSISLYAAAGVVALIRYVFRPSRDLSAVLWIIGLSLAMVFIASAEEYPSVVQAGLGSNDLTPEYMFMAGEGVEPGLHAMLGLVIFAAALIEVVTLFDVSYRMAYQDQLTGLPGRRAFDEAMKNLGKKYAIAMVDIDHFKGFNDSYGHDVGDQVLKLVGHVLKNNSKPGIAYRYGGEEFVLLYPGAENREVKDAAESVRKKIGSYPFALRKFLRPPFLSADKSQKSAGGKKSAKSRKSAGGSRMKKKDVPKTIRITVSMGLADHRQSELTPEEVMKKADDALYAAKENGRDRLEISK